VREEGEKWGLLGWRTFSGGSEAVLSGKRAF
jgi:hypothetical protein